VAGAKDDPGGRPSRCRQSLPGRGPFLKAVRAQKPSGPRLVAFFGVLYYSGLRPEELSVFAAGILLLCRIWLMGRRQPGLD